MKYEGMIVGGVEVGCGKDLKFTFPKNKEFKITKIGKIYITIEFYIEDELQISQAYKNQILELVSKIELNKKYTVNRIKLVRTIHKKIN